MHDVVSCSFHQFFENFFEILGFSKDSLDFVILILFIGFSNCNVIVGYRNRLLANRSESARWPVEFVYFVADRIRKSFVEILSMSIEDSWQLFRRQQTAGQAHGGLPNPTAREPLALSGMRPLKNVFSDEHIIY